MDTATDPVLTRFRATLD